MDKERKETSDIRRPIDSSSVSTRQLEHMSASTHVPLSRSLVQQSTTRSVDAPPIASMIATRPLLRTSSTDEYPGWEPASRGSADAADRPSGRLDVRLKEGPFSAIPIKPSYVLNQADSDNDQEDKWASHQQRRSLRQHSADLEASYHNLSQPPSGEILRASMLLPAPAAHMTNSRNPRRRDTIIDNPKVQRCVQSYGQDKDSRSRMVKDNVEKLLKDVKSTRDKHTKRALKTVWTLNFAVGLQVALGALTTGFAAIFRNSNLYVIIALLGGVSTLCASYLARMRGSSEPEKSLGFKKELTALKFDLENFLRHVDELSPMEEHIEERVRIRLSWFQQRYFDIRNAGLRRRFRDEITGSGYMEEQKNSLGVLYRQYRG